MIATRCLALITTMILFGSVAAVAADNTPHPSFETGIDATTIEGRIVLGDVELSPDKTISVHARRDGPRLILHAVSNGAVIGRAESIAGLRITPVYVRLDGKNLRIDILWNTAK